MIIGLFFCLIVASMVGEDVTVFFCGSGTVFGLFLRIILCLGGVWGGVVVFVVVAVVAVVVVVVIDRVVIDLCDPLRVVDGFGMVFFVDVTPGVAGECFLHDV